MLLKLLRQLAGARNKRSSNCARGSGASSIPESVLAAADRALAQGRFDDAERFYRRALAANRHDVEALCGLGVVAAGSERFDDARQCFESAIAFAPDRADALTGLGNVYRELDCIDESLTMLERARAVRPESTEVNVGYARSLRAAAREGEALEVLRHLLSFHPRHADAWLETGLALADLGEDAQAAEALEHAIAIEPDEPKYHLALAFFLLARGQFERGWTEYEWRSGKPCSTARALECLAQGREADFGQRLVSIHAEQGLGDQIMFASCVRDLIERAPRIALSCDPPLHALMRRSFPGIDVTVVGRRGGQRAEQAEREANEIVILIGSLPALFRRRTHDFPRHSGYLVADPSRVGHWRQKLHALGGKAKIGLSWKGGLRQTRRSQRSISPALLAEALRGRSDVVLVDLQHDALDEEAKRLEGISGVRMQRFPNALTDYDETAALVSALDLVVSVCNSVVHLAGALGRPVWVLAPKQAEWRYMRSGSSMPWYPTARLFRQSSSGDWHEPLAALTSELDALLGARSERRK